MQHVGLELCKQGSAILLLEDGKVKESGTFDELIALDGAFAELVKRQRL